MLLFEANYLPALDGKDELALKGEINRGESRNFVFSNSDFRYPIMINAVAIYYRVKNVSSSEASRNLMRRLTISFTLQRMSFLSSLRRR